MPYYIIDGHNVTRGLDKFARPKPDAERTVLLEFLMKERPQGRNQITVVFDGRPGRDFNDPSVGAIRVIFSDESSADDWIKRLVDHESNPRDVVVVTADRELGRWVRGAKARVISPLEFIALARRPAKGKPASKEMDEEITEEMKSIWLKKQS